MHKYLKYAYFTHKYIHTYHCLEIGERRSGENRDNGAYHMSPSLTCVHVSNWLLLLWLRSLGQNT